MARSVEQERRISLIHKIVEWAMKHDGDPPKVDDWRHVRDPKFVRKHGKGWPSYLTVIRYSPDGTWNGMIREAGFEPRGRGRPGYENLAR